MNSTENLIEAERSVRRKQGFRAHALAYVIANWAMIAGWAASGGRFWPLWPLTGWGRACSPTTRAPTGGPCPSGASSAS